MINKQYTLYSVDPQKGTVCHKDFRKRPEVMDNLRRMKEPVFLTAILSREEIHAMLECAANLKIKAIIALLYSSGLRFTECSLLKINDFDK